MKPLLKATAISLTGNHGTIFGPLSIELNPRSLCIISGEKESGKSSLLLALTGRLKGIEGNLEIAGQNASTAPAKTLAETSIAQLGQYLQPEENLTITEAIHDRAYIDNIPIQQAEERFTHFESLLELKLNRNLQLNDYDLLTQKWVSVVLALLRPASLVVLDDADNMLTPTQATKLYQYLKTIAEKEENLIIASGNQTETAPAGTFLLKLHSTKHRPREYQAATEATLNTKTSVPKETNEYTETTRLNEIETKEN